MEDLLSMNKKQQLEAIQQLTLLNKKSQLPANEIIKKQYEPDIKPQFRFNDKSLKNQKNTHYIPPRVKNQQFQTYGSKFHISDFLGYDYSSKLDQMIYFHYNNTQLNEIKIQQKNHLTRYMAGLFPSLSLLSSPLIKKQKDIYKYLSLQVPQLKDSIIQSFGKNSKGCSLDPVFSSNFVGANLMAAVRVKPFQYDLIIQNDLNSSMAEYFHFALKFIEQGLYTFNIVNLGNHFQLYNLGMQIQTYSFFQQSMKNDSSQQIKSGSGWSRNTKNAKIQKSQIRKQNQMYHQTYNRLSFEYRCKNRQQIVMFASSIPYKLVEYQKFLQKTLYKKIGNHMKMQPIQIGETIQGNPMNAYFIYHRKSKSSTTIFKSSLESNRRRIQKNQTLNLGNSSSLNNSLSLGHLSNLALISNSNGDLGLKTVVFMARQHPGDTSSSFIIEGVIQALMANTQFDSFKKNFQFVIIPFVNIDGIKYGCERTNLAGADLNKVWRHPNAIFEPQIYNLKKFLTKLNQTSPIALLIDLQQNKQSMHSYFQISPLKNQWQDNQLYPYLCSKRIPCLSFNKSNSLYQSYEKSSALSVLSQQYPKALVYTLKMSGFGWVDKTQTNDQENFIVNKSSLLQAQGKEFTPQSLRHVGSDLVHTYLEFLRLLDKNTTIKQRWAKQIQNLVEDSHTLQQIKKYRSYQKQYQDTWDRQLIKFNYKPFMPIKQELNLDKLKTRSENKQNQTNLNKKNFHEQLLTRSNAKKRTMPSLNNRRFDDMKQKLNISQAVDNLIKENSSKIANQIRQKPRFKKSIINQALLRGNSNNPTQAQQKFRAQSDISQTTSPFSKLLSPKKVYTKYNNELIRNSKKQQTSILQSIKKKSFIDQNLKQNTKYVVKDSYLKFQGNKNYTDNGKGYLGHYHKA